MEGPFTGDVTGEIQTFNDRLDKMIYLALRFLDSSREKKSLTKIPQRQIFQFLYDLDDF